MSGPTIPDARDRSSPSDFKGHLDFDGSLPGIYSFWNLSNIEHTFSLHRNTIAPSPTPQLTHIPISIGDPTHIDVLYRHLKDILVNACKNGFRGFAFAEKVEETSPLNDIIQFMYWAPVMTKEMRWFFKKNILKMHMDIVTKLKEPKVNHASFGGGFCAQYEDVIQGMKEFFEDELANPCPIPDDISEVWLKEFGEGFKEKYMKALVGGEGVTFKIAKPDRDKNGMSKFYWEEYRQ
jgi:hypothetical protein